jgi:hypothetical protein
MGCWLYVSVFTKRMSVYDCSNLLADIQSTAYHAALSQRRSRSTPWKRLLGSHQAAVDRGPNRGVYKTEIYERSWWSLDKGWQVGYGMDDKRLVYIRTSESCHSSLVNMLTNLGKRIGHPTSKVSFNSSILSSHHSHFITYCGFLCVGRRHLDRSATRPGPTHIRRQ